MKFPAPPSPGMIAECGRWARYAQTVLKARGVAIGLVEAGVLRCVATSGLFVPDVGSEFSKDGLAWSSAANDIALHSEDLVTHPETAAQECITWGARSVVLAPIHDDGRVRGVLVGVSDACHALSVFAAGTAERLANEMSAMLALFWNEPEPEQTAQPPSDCEPVGAGEAQAGTDTDGESKTQPPSAFLAQSATYLVQPIPPPQAPASSIADDAGSSPGQPVELTPLPPPVAATALPAQMPVRSAAVPRPKLVPRFEEPEPRPAPSPAPSRKSDTLSWYPEPDYSAYSGRNATEPAAPPRRPRPLARPVQAGEPSGQDDNGRTRVKVWGMRIFLVLWVLVAGATTWRLRDAMWAYLAGATPPSAEAAGGGDSSTDEAKAVMRRRAKPNPSTDSQRRESASSRASSGPASRSSGSSASGFAATPSRLLLRVEPTYPADARALHISGMVVLEAQVRKDGSVGTIKFVSGDTAFRQSALDAVKQWKYQPATIDGAPIESTAVIDLQFSPQ